jgi:hypothetical protein
MNSDDCEEWLVEEGIGHFVGGRFEWGTDPGEMEDNYDPGVETIAIGMDAASCPDCGSTDRDVLLGPKRGSALPGCNPDSINDWHYWK